MRKVVAVSGGVVSTFWLFVFMASLVSTRYHTDPVTRPVPPDSFFPTHFDERTPPPRAPLPKPEPEKKLPSIPSAGITSLEGLTRPDLPNIPSGNEMLKSGENWHLPTHQSPTTTGEQHEGSAFDARDARPLAQLPPVYPRELAQQGIQGWVKLRFDINEVGEPKHIVVIDAKPKTLFDRAAIAAVAKWRYQAATRDGKTVKTSAKEIVLDFKLE